MHKNKAIQLCTGAIGEHPTSYQVECAMQLLAYLVGEDEGVSWDEPLPVEQPDLQYTGPFDGLEGVVYTLDKDGLTIKQVDVVRLEAECKRLKDLAEELGKALTVDDTNLHLERERHAAELYKLTDKNAKLEEEKRVLNNKLFHANTELTQAHVRIHWLESELRKYGVIIIKFGSD